MRSYSRLFGVLILFPIAAAAGPQQQPRPLIAIEGIGIADYPSEALERGEQGTTRVALTVGPAGRVTGCRISQSSGSRSLDVATCRILVSRARFAPATDADGKHIAGTHVTSLTWKTEAVQPDAASSSAPR